MAYVRCENCKWSQDDCWCEGYNPFKSLLDWQDKLLNVNLDEPLKGHFDDSAIKEMGLEGKTWREYFIYEAERAGRKIKNMKWKTYEEFKNDPDRECPKCGCKDQFVWD